MRLSESRIRRIIREEVEQAVDEMAYAGDLGITRTDDEESESFFSGLTGDGPNRAGAEKFARSGRFRKLAEKHFANITGNVWVAPLIGVADDVYDSTEGTRVRLTPLVPAGIKRLERLGYEAPARVGADDIVILYSTMSTVRDAVATPWMIIHAMFDSGDSMHTVSPSYYTLTSDLMFGGGDEVDPKLLPLVSDYEAELTPALTMSSARLGQLQAMTDAYAEIMCQELLTTGGFKPDLDAVDSSFHEALTALRGHVRRCADEFKGRIRGKLVTVAVN